MYYCCSDLHGCYDKYRALLAEIDLKDADTLFVLGDVVDRGPQTMELLLDMMERVNVIPILGNHEYMAMQVLKGLVKEITQENLPGFDDTVEMLSRWVNDGGEETLTAFQRLDGEQQEAVLDYLMEFSLYEEVETGGRRFVLVHAGLMEFSEDRPLDDYAPHELIFERADYSRRYFHDRYLVTGHTPTRLIGPPARPDRIYQGQGHIALDCGCVYGGKMGAICLDTLEEYYV